MVFFEGRYGSAPQTSTFSYIIYEQMKYVEASIFYNFISLKCCWTAQNEKDEKVKIIPLYSYIWKIKFFKELESLEGIFFSKNTIKSATQSVQIFNPS